MTATTRTACRYCGEAILPEARKCRFCGEWLDRMPTAPSAPRAESQAWSKPPAEMSGKAVASLLCAILGGGLLGIPAIALGRSARSDIRRASGKLKGEGLALAGQILGFAQTALIGIVLAVSLLTALSHSPPHQTQPLWKQDKPVRPNGPIPIDNSSYPAEYASNASAMKTGDNIVFTFTLAGTADCRFLLYPADGSNLSRMEFDRSLPAGVNQVALSRNDGRVALTSFAILACLRT